MQDLEAHSKTCSSPQSSPSKTPRSRKLIAPSPGSGTSPSHRERGMGTDFLIISVTRSPPGATDLSPFKIITKTNLSQFPAMSFDVNRSQMDFQWLYDVLQDACPERIVPPLKPPISLDATISEFQRFLSRISTHKVLRSHHLFVVFLCGKSEELKSVKAKYRPSRSGDQVQYKPAVGRDTNSGPLVATKEYLTTLEQNLLGLANHLEQSVRRKTHSERTAHWFRAISESEPGDTYLKTASSDLARTCDTMETSHGDSEDTLLVHNLQSIADYVRACLVCQYLVEPLL
ncbi:Sorting nexin-7 [Geodia barretti]|nr:Sorting nexin-7 [Geodia barretti]